MRRFYIFNLPFVLEEQFCIFRLPERNSTWKASLNSKSELSKFRVRRQFRYDGVRDDSDEDLENTDRPATIKLTEQDIINRIVNTETYNHRIRPHGTNASNTDTGGPVYVSVNIYLRSISKIDDVNMVRSP